MIRLQAARGGEEARLFSLDLWKIYCQYLKREGIQVTELERRAADGAPRAIVAELRAPREKLRKLAEAEAGEHIVQRKTRSRRKDRIHTSSVWVSVVLVSDHDGTELEKLRSRLEIDTFRGHGAGGQHRNVRDTAVRARDPKTKITCEILSGRSQAENRERAALVVWERVREREASERHQAHQRAVRAQKEVVRTYDLVRGVVRDRRAGKAPWKKIQAGRLDVFAS